MRTPRLPTNGSRWSDPSLYLLGLVVGVVPIVALLARGGSWGVEPTLGAMFCLLSGAGLAGHLFRWFRGRSAARRNGHGRRYVTDVPSDTGSTSDTGADRRGYAGAVALVTAATLIAFMGRALFGLPDIVMLFLLAIMIVASLCGRGPSVLAALLSVASYDFFFVPPFYTFTVYDVRHTLTFAMMFATGLFVSGLTLRIRQQQRLRRAQEQETARLAEDAKAQALRARTEEMRSSLLSAVSHDLRTPLGAITGAATTLLDSTSRVSESQRRELLETICEEAERLERLVSNLLDMTRVESGALRVKREWLPLEEVVVSVVARLESKLGGRPLKTDIPDDLPLIWVDPILLEQVFVNLFDNISKYTPEGSGIEILARATDGAISIAVVDHGPGLPKGSENRVFEKFFRGPQARGGGAGLGLAICRGIVEAHGGTLSVENRPGDGATFRIHLPFVGTAPHVPADRDAAA